MLPRDIVLALIGGGAIGAVGAVAVKLIELFFTHRASNAAKVVGAATDLIERLEEEVKRLGSRVAVLEEENRALTDRVADLEKEKDEWLKSAKPR